MKIYEFTRDYVEEKFVFFEQKKKKVTWTLNPSAAYKNRLNGNVFACGVGWSLHAHSIKELPLSKLLNIMANELSIEETKKICKEYKWIAKQFEAYIGGAGDKERLKVLLDTGLETGVDLKMRRSQTKHYKSGGFMSGNTLVINAGDSQVPANELDENDDEYEFPIGGM